MLELVRAQDYGPLLAADQLAREMRSGRVLCGFSEAPISFPPTFKVVKGEPGLAYATKRLPAWCDRVLVRSNLPHKTAQIGHYYACPAVATSDHKPVAAAMDLPLGAWWLTRATRRHGLGPGQERMHGSGPTKHRPASCNLTGRGQEGGTCRTAGA